MYKRQVDGFGIQGRLAYEISSGLTAGVNISYDEVFDTRVSADLKVRFGGASTTAQRKAVQQLSVINALTSTPSNRDMRVHDGNFCMGDSCGVDTNPMPVGTFSTNCINGKCTN